MNCRIVLESSEPRDLLAETSSQLWRCVVIAFGLLLGIAIGAFSDLSELRADARDLEVSVRLRPIAIVISISGQDLALYATGLKAVVLETRGTQKWQVRFETLNGEPAWSVVDRDSGRSLVRMSGRIAELRGEMIRVDLRPSPSHLKLVAVKSGARFDLQLVGVLPIEEYVHGVVSAEVPQDWPLEALKAQAVAARSFTIAKLRERGDRVRDWTLEATIMDQVFDHARKHDLARKAVKQTEGEVLVGQKGVATAHYHADCGGHTDEPKYVWGGGESIGTAKDQCAKRPSSHWRMIASLENLTKKLTENGKIQFRSKIASLSVDQRTKGGRAKSVKLASELGDVATLTGEDLRAALGYTSLKSTKFEIKTFGDRAEFTGSGFGHGTGMCQWGARRLALSGKDYRKILKHYYSKLELHSLDRSKSDFLASR